MSVCDAFIKRSIKRKVGSLKVIREDRVHLQATNRYIDVGAVKYETLQRQFQEKITGLPTASMPS